MWAASKSTATRAFAEKKAQCPQPSACSPAAEIGMNDAFARQAHPRNGADPGLAFELELAAVQLGERLRQGKAETGALVAAAQTAIDLAKGRHGAVDVLGGD